MTSYRNRRNPALYVYIASSTVLREDDGPGMKI